MRNDCARTLVRRLAGDGGWASRASLMRGIGYSEARVDDELADLVVAGEVLFNERAREYKLAGTALARRALRKLVNEGGPRQVLGGQSACKKFMNLGIATRTTDANGAELLVMAELQFDYPTEPDGVPRMYCDLLAAFDRADEAVKAKDGS